MGSPWNKQQQQQHHHHHHQQRQLSAPAQLASVSGLMVAVSREQVLRGACSPRDPSLLL